MLAVGGRHTDGSIQIRQPGIRSRSFRLLDPPFHLADRVEILRNAIAIRWTDILLQPCDVRPYPIEQTGIAVQLCPALCGTAAVAEQPLESNARMRLGR